MLSRLSLDTGKDRPVAPGAPLPLSRPRVRVFSFRQEGETYSHTWTRWRGQRRSPRLGDGVADRDAGALVEDLDAEDLHGTHAALGEYGSLRDQAEGVGGVAPVPAREEGLGWTTVSSKVKQAMQGVFKYGRKEGLLLAGFDPFKDIDCEASSDYEAITCTPEQTLTILNQLAEPEFILTLLIATTGLSISEALGLQWADAEYDRNRIMVRRSWVEEVGGCKNVYRKAPVAMHPVLGGYLKHWQKETMYANPIDWVFASIKLKGAKPRCGSIASQRYLYPAAAKAGVFRSVEERNRKGKLLRVRYFDLSGKPIRRWGWHNLRHSLASWLVSNGVDVKTVSSMLRHSNVRTTLGIYSHAVDSNRLAAQEQFLNTLLSGNQIQ